ncbi:MAG: hypothetical protein ACRD7E_06540, partial [Bryobacteraceae bacterium]
MMAMVSARASWEQGSTDDWDQPWTPSQVAAVRARTIRRMGPGFGLVNWLAVLTAAGLLVVSATGAPTFLVQS